LSQIADFINASLQLQMLTVNYIVLHFLLYNLQLVKNITRVIADNEVVYIGVKIN